MSRNNKRAIFTGIFIGILAYISLKIGIDLSGIVNSIFLGIIAAMVLALSGKLFK